MKDAVKLVSIPPVLTCADVSADAFQLLLMKYGIQLEWVESASSIPGSFWGDSEAGLIANRLLVRGDTPVHSALHEACHYICMDGQRRSGLHTDAGGGYDEENGVCYLQILLADFVPEMGRDRMLLDMDAWGYSFRLGSSRAWFEGDAKDAYSWLLGYGLVGASGAPTWQCRE